VSRQFESGGGLQGDNWRMQRPTLLLLLLLRIHCLEITAAAPLEKRLALALPPLLSPLTLSPIPPSASG
jgi:hypothetical protein